MISLTKNGAIPPYLAFPRFLLESELNDTARLVYVLLLDRGRLSQRNDGWADDSGEVYVVFPIEKLAAELHRSTATVKTALSSLERAGLIARRRQGVGRPNHIRLYFPVS